MVAITETSGRNSNNNNGLTILRGCLKGKVVYVAAVVFSFVIWFNYRDFDEPYAKKGVYVARTANYSNTALAAIRERSGSDNTNRIKDESFLCMDPEEDPSDPIEQRNIQLCQCTHPTVAVSREIHQQWTKHHKSWIKSVLDVQKTRAESPLDLVMVGDSLIGHWNGTFTSGHHYKPEFHDLFKQYFTKSGGGKIEGLALGSSGDTSRNLLWHLQNGILTNQFLHPKVWLILIGTNDLGHAMCSKQSALDGILYVAEHIKEQRPDAAILIHGLLPRGGDVGNGIQMDLGRYWQHIQWINERLQEAVEQRKQYGFFYMDSGDTFINDDGTALHSGYIRDGIHPELPGMKAWGPLIVKAVLKILKKY